MATDALDPFRTPAKNLAKIRAAVAVAEGKAPRKRRVATPVAEVATSFTCNLCEYRAGEQGAYQAHLRAHINELRAELQEIKEGLPRKSNGQRLIAECGTESGYTRHYRMNEPPCDACRSAMRERRRERMRDPGRRERRNSSRRERLRQDPEYRERRNAVLRELRQDPEYRERENAKARERRRELRQQDPEYRERENAKLRERRRAARVGGAQ